MPVPVILDCDPGHDDAFAIWLAAGNPHIDVRAITTVGGNSLVTSTTRNARVVCTVAGIHNVPIAAGAAAPLVRTLTPAEEIHGSSGLDGPVHPEPVVGQDRRAALELIRDTLDAADEPVVINATGPLTNIALFLRTYPDRISRIKEIVWMGGSTERGNATPYAEFNAWVDPEAADIVLKSGLPFTMVGLNVTHQALVTEEVLERIAAVGNHTAAFGTQLLKHYCAAYAVAEDMPAAPLHDPLTIALLAAPGLLRTTHARVDVELAGTETAGATSVDLHGVLDRPANAHVATGVDVEGFWQLLEEALRVLR